jgi:hypothetical protein
MNDARRSRLAADAAGFPVRLCRRRRRRGRRPCRVAARRSDEPQPGHAATRSSAPAAFQSTACSTPLPGTRRGLRAPAPATTTARRPDIRNGWSWSACARTSAADCGPATRPIRAPAAKAGSARAMPHGSISRGVSAAAPPAPTFRCHLIALSRRARSRSEKTSLAGTWRHPRKRTGARDGASARAGCGNRIELDSRGRPRQSCNFTSLCRQRDRFPCASNLPSSTNARMRSAMACSLVSAALSRHTVCQSKVDLGGAAKPL